MIRIAVIAGSTRPNRKAMDVACWVMDVASLRADVIFELVDLQDFKLPLLDEPLPPALGQYTHPHTIAWAEKIAGFDGFVFVTPEYNHGIPGALKNAIDFLYREWNNKAAGFVSYGSAGGVRAVESLRLVMGELQVADVREAVMLSLHHDFDDQGKILPTDRQERKVDEMLDQVVCWSRALHAVRNPGG